jgi:GNAT superfamily N-acetyltransferase
VQWNSSPAGARVSRNHLPAVTGYGIHCELAGAERVDEVRELWLELHRYHRTLPGAIPLIEDDMLSWERRRALYLDRLRSETGFLVLATEAETVVGYALVCIERGPDDTFAVGDRYAELFSLSVVPQRRARGIGTQLLDFLECELARRSIYEIKVAAMVGNRGSSACTSGAGIGQAEIVLYKFGSGGEAR